MAETAPMITGSTCAGLRRHSTLVRTTTGAERGSPMEGQSDLITNAERIVAAARRCTDSGDFLQELHRPSGIDFGRELDGAEGVHCVEGRPGTDLWPTLRPGETAIITSQAPLLGVLRHRHGHPAQGSGADTLILIGSLTDVCVHYTFVDAHQRDFFVRVVEDCVIGSTVARHEASLDAMEYFQHGACWTRPTGSRRSPPYGLHPSTAIVIT